MFHSHEQSMRNISTADFAYHSIKKEIITGKLSPEEAIVEEQMAKQLDISRTPLREALQRLELEELVVRKRNGRLKVAQISIQEVKEIFTIRGLLEGVVVGQAAKNSTEKDIRQLTRLINLFEEATKNEDVTEILYFGGQFHSYIYEMSRNKTAIKILYQLNDHILRYRRFVPKQFTNQQQSLSEHKEIVMYIEAKDTLQAKKAMETHIMNSLHSVIESLKHREKDDLND